MIYINIIIHMYITMIYIYTIIFKPDCMLMHAWSDSETACISSPFPAASEVIQACIFGELAQYAENDNHLSLWKQYNVPVTISKSSLQSQLCIFLYVNVAKYYWSSTNKFWYENLHARAKSCICSFRFESKKQEPFKSCIWSRTTHCLQSHIISVRQLVILLVAFIGLLCQYTVYGHGRGFATTCMILVHLMTLEVLSYVVGCCGNWSLMRVGNSKVRLSCGRLMDKPSENV